MSTQQSNDTWAARLFTAVRNYLPWPQFTAFQPRPPLQLAPMMTDDDTQFHGDILYFRGLLDHIHDGCIDTGARITDVHDTEMRLTLDAALELVRADRFHIDIDWAAA